ncbi:NADH-quinone oxidoreductase subunit NuoG [Roseiflexus sp.]|uniref:NADH-quinone oxidoreductase subunit NuoG n=1 Tax=Roseiflexus sp. TaxID=2562120 RepID=UPI0021DC66A1|nr:NADH-quinone oxidoreductase subunit NuoG [Roseiflexus sp.]GIW02527.1 MAG: NADH-quinone oxidoreductase [Roseiflexus sp.]
MPDVTLVIDGQTVTVPAGTNIVDAARSVGVAIPVFCYHPKLKPVGMCRMCLVEVWTPKIDPTTRQVVIGEDGKPVLALMMGKLQPGCVTPVSDGMEVRTTTQKVRFAQKGQLEFLLTSHPLDCPVCDKGGECPLQNLTMQFGPSTSRFDYADKIHFEKPIPLGDLIFLDRERCILCSRCVRFQDDIAGDPVLGFDNRGRAWEIISKSDPPFDSKFSGNTTDICPVGALTTADFRFKARVWELRPVPSICPHCPVGCNISLDMRYDRIMRVMPRENEYVNEIWICDKGRFGMRFIESPERLRQPLIRKGDTLTPATWDEAITLVAEKLSAIRTHAGAAALGGLAGPDLPNEDLYLFQKLFRQVLKSPNLDCCTGAPGEADLIDLGATLGVGKGTNLSNLGAGTAVLVVGADPEEEAPLYVLRLRGIVARGGDLTVINPYPTKLDRTPARVIRPRAGAEAFVALALLKTLIEEELIAVDFVERRVQGLDDLKARLRDCTVVSLCDAAGIAEDDVRAAARVFAKADHGIIIYGRVALAVGADLIDALADLTLLTGHVGKPNNGIIPLFPGANVRGALDMGVNPGAGKKRGLKAREMWTAAREGRLRGMIIAGMNPVRDHPAVAEALDALEFLVVQDMFLTETAQRADVVLPTASIAGREGTFTNAERRVQRFRQARIPEYNTPAGWDVAQRLARALIALGITPDVPDGQGDGRAAPRAAAQTAAATASPDHWDYVVAGDVADEIAARVRGYADTTYESLGLTRKPQWGRQPNEAIFYDGTSYENTEGVGVQIAAEADNAKTMFLLRARVPSEVNIHNARPYILLAAPRAYDSRTWSRDSKLVPRMVAPHLIVNSEDAAALEIAPGHMARIESESGSAVLPVQIDRHLPRGLVIVPDVDGAPLSALQTGPLTRIAITAHIDEAVEMR